MKEDEKILIRAFYSQSLDLDSNVNKGELVLHTLLKFSCNSILNLILENFNYFSIEKKDIPQFSDINDCFDKVPFLLENCGIDGVDYRQMGYLLRTEPRKEGADKKYGENHMKTAALMGLCSIKKRKAYINTITTAFNKLSNEEIKDIRPKLALHIPFIQNYYFDGASQEALMKNLSILSESTIIRRKPNCVTLIEIIDNSLFSS